MKILLIEDEPETAGLIERAIADSGGVLCVAETAEVGVEKALAYDYDTIIADRLLPRLDGIEAIRLLRINGVKAPILILTALSDTQSRVEGLEAGADDYLAKPFALEELMARIRALLRRQLRLSPTENELIVGSLSLDRTTQRVSRSGRQIDLLPREYKILELLMINKGQVVTKKMLLQHVWGYDFDPMTSVVQTHVSRLRAKVDKPFALNLISTVRGVGYVIGSSV